MSQIRSEIARLRSAISRVDTQTAVILISVALLVFLHRDLGSRGFYNEHIADLVGQDLRELGRWVWRFGMQAVAGFVIPAVILVVGFRSSPAKAGLGLGDWKFSLKALAGYIPLVLAGTWILSDQNAFQRVYPHFRGGIDNGSLLLAYEISYLFYWIGWEYLWRGFILFGTRHTFGLYAILIQALPFALLHASKPVPEQLLSILGGIALGAVVWRARSFWIAVPIHAIQMALIDFFCAQRIRTGVDGISFGDFVDLFSP